MPLTLAQVIIIVMSFGVVGAISSFIYIFVLYVSFDFLHTINKKNLVRYSSPQKTYGTFLFTN